MRSLLASLVLFYGAINLAHAWVPPSFHIIRMLAQKHSALDQGRFQHRLTFYKRDGTPLRPLTEILVINNDQAFVRVVDERGAELGLHSRKLIGLRNSDIERPVLYDLVFLKDNLSIFEHFRALGLPLKTESELYSEKEGPLPYKPEYKTVAFARFQKTKPSVAISEDARKVESDDHMTQLWVEKDSYLPIEAILPSAPERGVASEPLEFHFTNGYQIEKRSFYPRAVEIKRGDRLWVKLETLEVRLGQATLERARLRSDPEGELKDFLETYFKWVR